MNDPVDYNATEALAALHDVRTGMAQKVATGGWRYDLSYGLFCGVLVAGQGLEAPFNILSSAVAAIGLGLLAISFAKRCGVWVSGIMPKRARWVALGIGLFAMAGAVGVAWAKREGMAWVGLPAGLIMAVIGVTGSRLWRWVYRSDLADGTDTREDALSRQPQLILFGLGLAAFAVSGGIALLNKDALNSDWVAYGFGMAVGITTVGVLYALKRAGLFRRRGR